MTGPEIAMIVLASLIAIGLVNVLCIESVWVPTAFGVFIFHLTILSLGIHYGGVDTTFISYMCWSWTYFVYALVAASDPARIKVPDGYDKPAQGIGGLLLAAVLGTAIASAAYNTGPDAMDNYALCIFGLVTTILMYGPVLAAFRRVNAVFAER